MNKFRNLNWFVLLSIVTVCCSNDRGNASNSTLISVDKEVVTAYVTTATRSLEFVQRKIAFADKIDNRSPFTISLVSDEHFQTIDGFGAAITGSTAYNLLKMSKENRNEFLKKTFSESEGMGQSYVRISIGCSDFSLSEYTCCDKKGIENFALQEEELKYVIPILKEILAINPNLKVMGTPWTPPRWMKVNNLTELKPFDSWTSGHLNPTYYQDYATYFVEWIKSMAEQGIKIYSITPQNEPLNRGNSASLYMGWQEQNAFIKEALGPKLKASGLDTKLYLYDHNYDYDSQKQETKDQKQYPLQIYADTETSQYVTGAAYHNYGGYKTELLAIQKANPNKELIFTETSIGEWNDGRNFARHLIEDMEEIALGTVNNWCKAVIVWNLMLDSEKGPFRPGGCNSCFGAVDIDKATYKTITRNSHYLIIGHLSSVVKPGAVRIGTSGYSDKELVYSAFKNTDESYAFVILNKANVTKKINLYDGKKNFVHEVPAKAVVSYRWFTNK